MTATLVQPGTTRPVTTDLDLDLDGIVGGSVLGGKVSNLVNLARQSDDTRDLFERVDYAAHERLYGSTLTHADGHRLIIAAGRVREEDRDGFVFRSTHL